MASLTGPDGALGDIVRDQPGSTARRDRVPKTSLSFESMSGTTTLSADFVARDHFHARSGLRKVTDHGAVEAYVDLGVPAEKTQENGRCFLFLGARARGPRVSRQGPTYREIKSLWPTTPNAKALPTHHLPWAGFSLGQPHWLILNARFY